jgi:hypothetical protein
MMRIENLPVESLRHANDRRCVRLQFDHLAQQALGPSVCGTADRDDHTRVFLIRRSFATPSTWSESSKSSEFITMRTVFTVGRTPGERSGEPPRTHAVLY